MFVERAYSEREKLSARDLDRLRAALADKVLRYQEAIRNYPPERLERYGVPFLLGLQEKVATVDALLAARARTAD